MSATLILIIFVLYTLILFSIAFFTSKKAKTDSFFVGERKMSWPIVAYGMIGASLSGVTFISIPGDVQNSFMSYLLVVLGNLVGYFVIAYLLLPIYYKMNLTTIYTYLSNRFGTFSHKTSSIFFILSKIFGAAGRLFLVAFVLHTFVFSAFNIPFWITASLFIGLIICYTYKGGIKTIVWTDTLQTTFMIASLIICFIMIAKSLNISSTNLIGRVFDHQYSQIIISDVNSRYFFLKQFLSGIFMAIAFNGLDQDMMQKNLSCKDIKSAQKNIISMSITMLPVVFLFLILGVSLYIFADYHSINLPHKTDEVFPLIMLQHLGPAAAVVFLIGLVSAAYSSGDSALTSLTTSFCVDFLDFEGKNKNLPEEDKKRKRIKVHVTFAIIMIFIMLLFKQLSNQSIITTIFDIAGYTYGPLLGLFSVGIFTKIQLKDRYVPIVAILAPTLCFILTYISKTYWGYTFGFEKIILNALLTIIGLLMIRKTSQR